MWFCRVTAPTRAHQTLTAGMRQASSLSRTDVSENTSRESFASIRELASNTSAPATAPSRYPAAGSYLRGGYLVNGCVGLRLLTSTRADGSGLGRLAADAPCGGLWAARQLPQPVIGCEQATYQTQRYDDGGGCR